MSHLVGKGILASAALTLRVSCNIIQCLYLKDLSSTHSCTETGLLPSPCFPNFLARTTFVLVSLSEVKIPGQDAIFGDFVFNSSKMQERGGKG